MLNGVASGVAEFFANILVGTFLMQFGVKNVLLVSFTMMAASSALYLFPILTLDIWYACIIAFMRASVTCAFAAVFYGTNDLFRADLVAIIFALCNMFARLLTMAVPSISTQNNTTVMAVYFGLSLLGLTCSGFIESKRERGKGKKDKRKKKKGKKQRD